MKKPVLVMMCISVSILIVVSTFLVGFGKVSKSPDYLCDVSYDGYRLEKTVILSRHNMRTPLVEKDSFLEKVTPYEWHKWTSEPGKLTERGYALEQKLGSSFRDYFLQEGLLSMNENPAAGQIRVYANSEQRTVESADSFMKSLLPQQNIEVEFHNEVGQADEAFSSVLSYTSEGYNADVVKQINKLYGKTIAGLADNYKALEKVINITESEAFKNNEISHLSTKDTQYLFEQGRMPWLTGSLQIGYQISDTLICQYYEEGDDKNSGSFTANVALKDWEKIGEIRDVFESVLFKTPLISNNIGYPILKELKSEIECDSRKISFLSGHDANVESSLTALGAAGYKLPNAIEKQAPVGCKLMFSKWIRESDGESFWSVDLVYPSLEQIKDFSTISEKGPLVYPITLSGVSRNKVGLYSDKDFKELFDRVLKEHDEQYNRYCKDAA